MVWKLNTVLVANMDLVKNLWFLPLPDSVAEAWCTSVYWECSSYWQILHNQGKTDLLSFARALSSLVLILLKTCETQSRLWALPGALLTFVSSFKYRVWPSCVLILYPRAADRTRWWEMDGIFLCCKTAMFRHGCGWSLKGLELIRTQILLLL